jgi:hypothetical protein
MRQARWQDRQEDQRYFKQPQKHSKPNLQKSGRINT